MNKHEIDQSVSHVKEDREGPFIHESGRVKELLRSPIQRPPLDSNKSNTVNPPGFEEFPTYPVSDGGVIVDPQHVVGPY